MRFKTCSYKSINILEKYSFVPISIEANPPKSYTGVTLPELAPLPFLIKGLQNGTISKICSGCFISSSWIAATICQT